MSDIPKIPPQRARAALVARLREMADAIEAGDVQWAAAVVLYTPEASQKHGHAFSQLSGFPKWHPDRSSWMLPLGVLRASFRDFEDHLLDIGSDADTDESFQA